MTATFRSTGVRSAARRVSADSHTAQQQGGLRRGRIRRRSRQVVPSQPVRSELELRVRPLWPDDGEVLDAVFEGLSQRSRYLRFHTPVRQLSDRFRDRLLDVDGQDRVALVAELASADGGWRPVGITRLARTGPGEAEVAIAVVDAMHRRGVARRLLTSLGEQARALDVTVLRAQVLWENRAARALFAEVFTVTAASIDDGVVDLTCVLGTVGRPGAASAYDLEITPYDLFGDLYA